MVSNKPCENSENRSYLSTLALTATFFSPYEDNSEADVHINAKVKIERMRSMLVLKLASVEYPGMGSVPIRYTKN